MSKLHAARLAPALMTLVLLAPHPASAQSQRVWGRVSFAAQSSTATDSGVSRSLNEVVTTFTLSSGAAERGAAEFSFDMRAATYPAAEDRSNRVSIYEAYVGRRLAGGRVGIRAGQLWLNELGALGAVGGFLAEYRQPQGTRALRVRAGVFGGLEPKILDAGYTSDIRKLGGYVALDGQGARRHVVGFVSVRNRSLTERSVLTVSNFLPVGSRVFVYQAAEVDLKGPGGTGSGGLNYFFTNARVTATKWLELQGNYHRGRSIDARTITTDMLNGRPISQKALEGLLFETAGGRAWINLPQRFRVFGGYSRDRNNREDAATHRLSVGVFNPNLFKTGIDLNVTGSRYERPTSTYDSWDATIGRSVGPKVYLSGGYSSSLSVIRLVESGGYLVENRPRTTRYSASGSVYLTRRVALLVTGERLRDGSYTDRRWMTHLSFRF